MRRQDATWRNRIGAVLALAGLAWFAGAAEPSSNIERPPGVTALFRTGEKVDALRVPGFAFFQKTGEAPTPFLPSGPYDVEFTGIVTVELRQQTVFQAELQGSLALSVNGRTVFQAEGTGGLTAPSAPVRLNKGTNWLVARFTPPRSGDAQLRLLWGAKGALPQPIPETALSAVVSPEVTAGALRREGRGLFAELHCAKCHTTSASGLPELAMDAPDLAGIGRRLDERWLAAWIENPAAVRPTATMPRLLHGEAAREEAQAIAAYLAAQYSGRAVEPPEAVGDGERGRQFFETMHCGACHTVPGTTAGDTAKLALDRTRGKFQPGTLAGYLARPHAHFHWNPMPDFHLSPAEAADLAAYLGEEKLPKRMFDGSIVSPATLAQGKDLLRERGCLNCHTPADRVEGFAKPATALAALPNPAGCLAPEGAGRTIGRAPIYRLTDHQRAALHAFLASGLASLEQDSPREFALRQVERLNCRACHGAFDGFPPFEILGSKLQADWSAKFIGGEIRDKPRPWLAARMPAFPAAAHGLAHGLAMLHGFSDSTPNAGPVDQKLAEIGRKLVSAEGGFACLACHAIGPGNPAPVTEGAGINFSWSALRLRPSYYRQWTLNPPSIDPRTKMPVYFDEAGRSPLADILEGDGLQQIDAIWEYLRGEAARR